MGLSTVGYAWGLDAPDPLAKLVLLAFADGCNELGEAPFNAEKAAAFCGVAVDDVCAAFGRLIGDELLAPIAEDFEFLLVGFTPTNRPDVYVKRKMSPKRRREVLDRDDWKCAKCGAEEDLTVDHILSERAGGSDALSNLQTLCMPCNRRKGFKAYG